MGKPLSEETAQALLSAMNRVDRKLNQLIPVMRHDERMGRMRAEREERQETIGEQISGKHHSYLERVAKQVEGKA